MSEPRRIAVPSVDNVKKRFVNGISALYKRIVSLLLTPSGRVGKF